MGRLSILGRLSWLCLRCLWCLYRRGSFFSDLGQLQAVSLVLNYVTAYQMMHRVAHASPGQRVLIHGAAGGVGFGLGDGDAVCPMR